MRNKLLSLLSGIILFLLTSNIACTMANQKLTYLEFTTLDQTTGHSFFSMTDTELIYQFKIPYELFHSAKIFLPDSCEVLNSSYEIYLTEQDSDSIICSSQVVINNEPDKDKPDKYPYTINLPKILETNGNTFYELHIKSADSFISHDTSGFSLQIYGSDTDPWWIGFYMLLAFFISFSLAWILYSCLNRIPWNANKLLHALLISSMVLLVMYARSTNSVFTDENDNIRSGMIIARGGVLYKDYITQHTPVTNYLCAVFALLGAGSVEQFRLSYYLFLSFIWALICIRYTKHYGFGKIAFLALGSNFINSFIFIQGSQILADNLQGICMTVLLLEFLEYRKDKTLHWDRSILVSACIWGSFGSAFISVYSLFIIFIAVVVYEIMEWHKNGFHILAALQKYYKLLISVLVPLITTILYFAVNHGLSDAYMLTYKFNRVIYPQYYGGFGNNILKPFYYGIKNIFTTLGSLIQGICTGHPDTKQLLCLLILASLIFTLSNLIAKKHYATALICFLFISCSASRSLTLFHGLPAWYIMIAVITIFTTREDTLIKKILSFLPKLTACFVLLLLPVNLYFNFKHYTFVPEPVSRLDSEIIARTEPDEKLFIDTWSHDSIYPLYKGHYPVNRLTYFLPWYLDWYEQTAIEDLNTYKPELAIYDPERTAWGYENYSPEFAAEISKHYTRLSDNPADGWKYLLWIRND